MRRMPEREAINHYPVDELRWTGEEGQWLNGSRVLLCRQPATTAIVFVHGWGGGAHTTWEAFPHAVRFSPETATADAFLLAYASRKFSVATYSSHLRTFFHDLLHAPAKEILDGSLPRDAERRPAKFTYKQVILVAHSMGAVISRRALLDLDERPPRDGGLDDNDRKKIRLLLFAPAHKGSTLPLLIASGLGLDWIPGATLAGNALTHYYRSLRDLAINSESLRRLEADTKAAREGHASRRGVGHHLIAEVYHAADDKVVEQDRFDRDHEMPSIFSKDHRSLCKPTDNYRRPVVALRDVLAAAMR
jgi:pimeloyl-ACP methyl ester carboxylesterase